METSTSNRRKLSPKEAALQREKESLRLSRQRVLQQLEASRNPHHRELLERTLAELDKKLADS